MNRQHTTTDELPLSLTIRSSREAALRVLDEHRITGMWVSDLLDRTFREAALPPSERGLATEIACGVVRRQATLDAVLKSLVSRPVSQVEAALWTILRIGVYQILMLDGVPPHAAVHETVELCKRVGQFRWSGFVNGVLRAATRLATTNFQSEPSADAVPTSAGRYRTLTKPIFADPSKDLATYLANAYSFPLWLIKRWQKRLSDAELIRFCEWFNSPPTIAIRANRLKSDSQSVLQSFNEANISAHQLPEHDLILIDSMAGIDQLPGFADGSFVIQDASASRAAIRLAPQPGQTVWDVCAAPGGKTCHLAELMNDQGTIIATDIRSDRLRAVEQNANRLGVSIIQTRMVDEAGMRLPNGPFDRILVDVPCSNTGVLAKRPEARWRITPEGLDQLAEIQFGLLCKSIERLGANGKLVYSTCSIEPSENEEIVARALAKYPDIKLAEDEHFVPGQPTDGAYQALLVKASSH